MLPLDQEANMNISTRNREIIGMGRQLAELQEANARRTETFAGISVLFGLVSLTVVAGGYLLRDPEFAIGAALSLTAAAVFALAAYDLRVSRRAQPQLAQVEGRPARVAPLRRAA